MTTLATGSRSGLRPAFSLIEVLLVMALLVLAGALAAPAFTEGTSSAKLRDAANKLSQLWSQARLDAMTLGRPLLFQCTLGAGSGTVSGPGEATAVGAEGAPAAPSAGASSIELDGIVFRRLLVAEPAGAAALGAEAVDGMPSMPVVFHPDGSTSDAECLLEAESGPQLLVTLRGLTGSSRVADAPEESGGPTQAGGP